MAKAELAVRKLPTLALLIDNVDFDLGALDWLYTFWQDCDQMFGIVLCGTQDLHATIDEAFGELLNKMPQVRACCTDAIIVRPLTEQQFNPHVIVSWITGLQAQLSPKVKQGFTEFNARVWNATQGNWAALTAIATVFDQKLRAKGDTTRMITPEIVEEVFAQLAGVRQVWQESTPQQGATEAA